VCTAWFHIIIIIIIIIVVVVFIVVVILVVTMYSRSICVPEQFYVHATNDMPAIGRDKPHWEFRGYEQELYVEHVQIVASPALRHLDLKQRGCLFRDEMKSHLSSGGTWKLPIYTYNFCKMACRIRRATSYCNCIPFFYRNIG
jgi:hypothetical protein